jgi:hypothetical protein
MNKIKKIITVIILLILPLNTAWAKISTEVKTQIEASSILNCEEILAPLFDQESARFFTFLDQHFKNKASTSNLTNTAIARYRLFKSDINELYDLMTEQINGGDYDKVLERNVYCKSLKEIYITEGKNMMYTHIATATREKQAFLMAEKLHAINNKMRTLNMKISELLSSYMSFEKRLQRFVGSCMKN